MKHIDIDDLQWIILISLWSYGHSQIICPDVAELASTVHLTCIFSGPGLVIYTAREWAPGKSLTVTCPKNAMTCINNPNEERINGTIVNTTHSFLEIQGTKRTDAGDWTCEVRDVVTTNCSLVLRKSPVCYINSDKNTNNLLVGEDVTLTVRIIDYYCSVPADFILKTGDTTEYLKRNESVEDIESNVINVTFNISDSHIGSLELLFSCNNIRKNVARGGVNTLLKRIPTTTRPTTTTADTAATFIQGPLSEEAQYSYLGIGVGIGIAVMLVWNGICILGIYLKRRTDRGDSSRSVDTEARQRQRQIHNLSNNHYDGLQGRIEDARYCYGSLTPHGDDYINPTGGADHEYEMPEHVSGHL